MILQKRNILYLQIEVINHDLSYQNSEHKHTIFSQPAFFQSGLFWVFSCNLLTNVGILLILLLYSFSLAVCGNP